MRAHVLVLALLIAVPAAAQTPPDKKLEPLPDAPPPPTIIKSGDGTTPADEQGTEPTVTIKTEGGSKIEEYRVRGHLYMLKVTPQHGPPYYLVDKDGDGMFESRVSDLSEKIQVPQWVLKTW
jgi:hypothetical protein